MTLSTHPDAAAHPPRLSDSVDLAAIRQVQRAAFGRDDEADLAVGSMLEVPDDICYRPFVTYRPTLITPLGHPLAGKPLLSHVLDTARTLAPSRLVAQNKA